MSDPWAEFRKAAPAASDDWSDFRPAPKAEPYKGSFLPLSKDDQGNVQFDSDAGVLGALKRAVTLPGDVMSGKTALRDEEGNLSDEVIGRSLETAGVATPVKPSVVASLGRKSVPSVADLKAMAGRRYDDAEAMGAIASPEQTFGLADDFLSIAKQEGLVSPSGRVNSSYPKVAEALKVAEDYAAAEMTVPQMRATRKSLSDAGMSQDAAEARIARLLLNKYDDFAEPIAPPLADAKGLYHRAKKGETVEDAIEFAKTRPDPEMALKNEFANLDRKEIRGDLPGFSPAEMDAIRKVSRGTVTERGLRRVGKLAPTGAVSFGVGAGVPFAIGNALGGPAAGVVAALGSSGAGYAARAGATKMSKANAEIAAALARNGGPIAQERIPLSVQKIMQLLATEEAGNLPASLGQHR